MGEKTKKKRKEGEMDWREVEALGMPDLPVILLVDSIFYIMFPHNEKMGSLVVNDVERLPRCH
jgi:hypothetical protein